MQYTNSDCILHQMYDGILFIVL